MEEEIKIYSKELENERSELNSQKEENEKAKRSIDGDIKLIEADICQL